MNEEDVKTRIVIETLHSLARAASGTLYNYKNDEAVKIFVANNQLAEACAGLYAKPIGGFWDKPTDYSRQKQEVLVAIGKIKSANTQGFPEDTSLIVEAIKKVAELHMESLM